MITKECTWSATTLREAVALKQFTCGSKGSKVSWKKSPTRHYTLRQLPEKLAQDRRECFSFCLYQTKTLSFYFLIWLLSSVCRDLQQFAKLFLIYLFIYFLKDLKIEERKPYRKPLLRTLESGTFYSDLGFIIRLCHVSFRHWWRHAWGAATAGVVHFLLLCPGFAWSAASVLSVRRKPRCLTKRAFKVPVFLFSTALRRSSLSCPPIWMCVCSPRRAPGTRDKQLQREASVRLASHS